MSFLKTERVWWSKIFKDSALFYKQLFNGGKNKLKIFLLLGLYTIIVLSVLYFTFAFTVLPELKTWFGVAIFLFFFIFHMWCLPGINNNLRKK